MRILDEIRKRRIERDLEIDQVTARSGVEQAKIRGAEAGLDVLTNREIRDLCLELRCDFTGVHHKGAVLDCKELDLHIASKKVATMVILMVTPYNGKKEFSLKIFGDRETKLEVTVRLGEYIAARLIKKDYRPIDVAKVGKFYDLDKLT